MMFRPIRYRKMPVVIEAMKFPESLPKDAYPQDTYSANRQAIAVYQLVESNTRGSFDPLDDMIPESGVSIDPETGLMMIATLEGIMFVKPGNYVIRGIEGEFYPCKPGIFEASYEKEDGS